MATIKITWVSKGYLGEFRDATILDLINKGYDVRGNATAELDFDFPEGDTLICNAIYANTNSYTGKFWDALQAVIPADRPHTCTHARTDAMSTQHGTYTHTLARP
jgi:hypothetical protein